MGQGCKPFHAGTWECFSRFSRSFPAGVLPLRGRCRGHRAYGCGPVVLKTGELSLPSALAGAGCGPLFWGCSAQQQPPTRASSTASAVATKGRTVRMDNGFMRRSLTWFDPYVARERGGHASLSTPEIGRRHGVLASGEHRRPSGCLPSSLRQRTRTARCAPRRLAGIVLAVCEQLVNNRYFPRPVKSALPVNKFTTYFYGSNR